MIGNQYVPNTSAHPQVQPTTQDKQDARQELRRAVGNAHEVLVSATTIFPLTLFPDTVTVDREKLTVTHRDFFMVGEVMTLRIEDILNVTAHIGPFFGSVKILTRFFDPHKPYTVNYLWRKDALKIQQIMQGYVIAIQKNVDCSALTTDELARQLIQLGRSGDGTTI